MKTVRWHYLFLALVAGSVWALDQASKAWIRENLALGAMIPVLQGPLSVRIVHWFNRGGVFGLFQEFSWGWTILALLITLALIRFYPHLAQDSWLRWALALQLGGALGNLTDRIWRGYVTDFIAVDDFPVFNFADVAITLGILLLLWSAWQREPESPEEGERPVEAPPGEGASDAPWTPTPAPEAPGAVWPPVETSISQQETALPSWEGEPSSTEPDEVSPPSSKSADATPDPS